MEGAVMKAMVIFIFPIVQQKPRSHEFSFQMVIEWDNQMGYFTVNSWD